MAHAVAILREGFRKAGGPVSLACSFSPEDLILIHVARKKGIGMGIFAIDTGRLPEETLEVAERVKERYGVTIDWYFPDPTELNRLLREKGPFSFRQSREERLECCRIRKVEPLARALSGLAGWVTGVRGEQTPTRGFMHSIETDHSHGGIVKINPLLEWSGRQVMEFVRDQSLPVSRLYRKGYRSIGCLPCSRPVAPWEDERAGRWWWEGDGVKECGLHRE